jgi:cell division protein FtsB
MSGSAKAARGYRMRPVPRRGPRGRGRGRIHWDKLGRVVLVLALFVILASYVNPLLGFVDAWRDAGSERAQLERLQSEHSRLRARAASLEDPVAAERAARKLGLVAEGETSYVVK